MSCETVTGSIVALLDGELAEAERRDVEAHVAACTACALELRQIDATRRVVSAHLTTAGGRLVRPRFDDLWQRVAADPESRPARPVHGVATRPATVARSGRSRRRWLVAGASAGLAVAAGLTLVVLAPRLSGMTSGPRDAQTGKPALAPPRGAHAVAAKAGDQTAPRVARREPRDDGAPAKQRLARRAEPDAAPGVTGPVAEGGSEEAVAVNELDPPRELLERPDLFLNYPLVRKLEKLRHLDSVLADHGTDVQPDDGGAG